MPTPIGNDSAYAAGTDLTNYRDWRQMADWIVNQDGDARGSESDFQTSAIVGVALATASGEIEAALLKGGRYAVADLAALTGNSSQLLIALTCWLAMGHLSKFKSRNVEELPETAKAEALLERLTRGERVFALDEQAVDANLEQAHDIYPRHQRPSVEAERMFGVRGRHDRC